MIVACSVLHMHVSSQNDDREAAAQQLCEQCMTLPMLLEASCIPTDASTYHTCCSYVRLHISGSSRFGEHNCLDDYLVGA